MIYTLTVNPSLDYIMYTDVETGTVNRSSGENIYPGGKGINVSIMLSRLGCENTAVCTAAGETGKMLENMLENIVNADMIRLENGMTRINVKVLGSKNVTELNGKGINVPFELIEPKLENITPDDYLVLSGSFFDYNLVYKIANAVNTNKIVYDIPKIEYAIKQLPFLIKPNLSELEEYFGCEIAVDEVGKYCSRILKLGCKNILVSLGENGAFFCNKNFAFNVKAPQGRAVNAVGAGDSMVAGVLYGITKGMSVEASVKFGVICGSATAFTEHLAQKEQILELCDEEMLLDL